MKRVTITLASCCIAVALLLVSAGSVQAKDDCSTVTLPSAPHLGMDIHYNPWGAQQCWDMPGDSVVIDDFTDDRTAVTEPWHWETSLYTPTTLVVGMVFRCYRTWMFGILSVPPDTVVTFDLHQCKEFEEEGDYTMTIAASPGLSDFELDMSIVEGAAHGNAMPVEWSDSTKEVVLAMDHVVVDFAAEEPIPTLSQWGVIAFGMLLLTAMAWAVWRRRVA